MSRSPRYRITSDGIPTSHSPSVICLKTSLMRNLLGGDEFPATTLGANVLTETHVALL